ncbi:MAG: hypothetical protein HRU46_09945 [Verrucomicrobiales bacterium]|nr:hypothetical protein [Verrucomicrobiales bacterium]
MAKPLLFVTGFFGAGKTTLLRSLAAGLRERGYSADVILNDYADARLDAATLEGYAASIAPIAASCACCGGLEELMNLCRSASQASGDLLLIELNGSADPLPILETFTVSASDLDLSPRLQVNLVDGRHWGKRDRWNPIEKRQLETSGAWILSHRESINDDTEKAVTDDVRAAAPYAAETNLEGLLDTLIEQIKGEEPSSLPVASLPGGDTDNSPGDLISDTVHQLTHHFEGWTVPLPGRVRQRSVEKLLADLPDWVIRIKVLVKLIEKPGDKWLFQRSGTDPVSEPIRIPEAEHISNSLICIGPKPDSEFINELVCKHFGGEAEALLKRAQ